MSCKITSGHTDGQVLQRFWAKVNRTEGGCWLWTASLRNKGYGAFAYTADGRMVQDRAHRFSWVIHRGEIPVGLFVLHRCDTPACVNPDHLFLGTKADNNADMVAKGRHVSGGTHTPVALAKYKRGEMHHKAKLTPNMVRAIRVDSAAGLSFAQLGRIYGICSGHVAKIVRRQLWKDVD
jgi:hypothetical protein